MDPAKVSYINGGAMQVHKQRWPVVVVRPAPGQRTSRWCSSCSVPQRCPHNSTTSSTARPDAAPLGQHASHCGQTRRCGGPGARRPRRTPTWPYPRVSENVWRCWWAGGGVAPRLLPPLGDAGSAGRRQAVVMPPILIRTRPASQPASAAARPQTSSSTTRLPHRPSPPPTNTTLPLSTA